MGRRRKEPIPTHHALVREAEQKKRARRKNGYRPADQYPTAEEAKQLITKYYETKRPHDTKIQKIRHTARGFTVLFESEICGQDLNDRPIYRGISRYGLTSLDHGWYTVLWLQKCLATQTRRK